MPDKIISGNPALDAMIDSLINVDSGSHKI